MGGNMKKISIFIVVVLMRPKISDNWRLVRKKASTLSNLAMESVQHVKLIRAFVSENEDYQKELDKLNKEVDKIRKDYSKRTEKGKAFIVHTYPGSPENVPQCTIFWYEEHSLLGDDYNLMTLACKKKGCEIMTCKEALKSLQIDGITLSTNVARLYESLNLPGILKETEMQGFETDENAAVTAIFMKLIIETPDPADPSKEIEQQHFYYYDIAENSLSSLSDHGYELP
jgi:ABC-type multidrug transport system fused ATPase/permease subunit